MTLSETTNQTGLVQYVEKRTRRPYGSANNELREIIHGLNLAFDDIMPLLLSYNDNIRWDDPNHTDAPIGYINIVSGQADYKLSEDDNSLDILNITNVRILPSATATDYVELDRMTADDDRITSAQSPNANENATPTHFIENGNRLYLFPEPDYASTNGIEIFFGREQARFTVTGTSGDDTTEPGIPIIFHRLLGDIESLRWISDNRPDDANQITLIREDIRRQKKEIRDFIDMRNPNKARIRPKGILYK